MNKTALPSLTFREDGTVETLYNEELPLDRLGEVEIKRWSNVEFNNKKQKWEVRIAGKVLFEDTSRQKALHYEHYLFEQMVNERNKEEEQ